MIIAGLFSFHMDQFTIREQLEYRRVIDSLYEKELGPGIKFSMMTSLTPAIPSDTDALGFIERYETIKQFLSISQELFRQSLFDSSLKDIRDVILNEVNREYGVAYHQRLYRKEVDIPYFFRTDEAIPGKITEIQYEGSGWGNLNSLQTSISFMPQRIVIPLHAYNRCPVAQISAEIIRKLTHDTPLIFHQIDESSNMLDMNYFISATRKFGLKYLGHDIDVTFKNINFVRTHSFMEEVVGSEFPAFMNRYYRHELLFDIFPSILFFQKISLLLPFWDRTSNLYPDRVREIFPFTSLVTDSLELENGERISIEEFSDLPPSQRDYYLKYAGADGTINWGSKSVYNLGKINKRKCELFFATSENWISP